MSKKPSGLSIVVDNSPRKKKGPGLSIMVDDVSPPKKKPSGLSIDVGTPQSRIGTPKSSTGSVNGFASSPIRTYSFPYTELVNKEISERLSDLYLEIKSHGRSVTNHSRHLEEEGISGKLRYSMNVYKHPNPQHKLLLKEYSYGTRHLSLETLLLLPLFEEKLFKEIYLQKKAERVAKKNKKEQCRVSIPSIIEFGKYSEGYTTYFYIIMEFAEGVSPVTLRDCESLKERVIDIDNCLQGEGVHHNDLNKGNVIVQSEGSITFIDFGEASEDMDRFDSNIFNCNPGKKKGGKKNKSKKNKSKKNKTKKQKR